MAAPVATPRVAPTGKYLKDGYKSVITFSLDTNVEVWEKSVTPPSIDGGDPIDTTTMHNVAVRTKAARSLFDIGDVTTNVAYDPICYNTLKAMINVHQTITVTFPDGSTLAFFGYLKMFEPSELQEGTFPEATLTIVATNVDSSGVEQVPVLTNVAGT